MAGCRRWVARGDACSACKGIGHERRGGRPHSTFKKSPRCTTLYDAAVLGSHVSRNTRRTSRTTASKILPTCPQKQGHARRCGRPHSTCKKSPRCTILYDAAVLGSHVSGNTRRSARANSAAKYCQSAHFWKAALAPRGITCYHTFRGIEQMSQRLCTSSGACFGP